MWQSRIITIFLPLFGPGWCWVFRPVQQRLSMNITLSTYLGRRKEMMKIFGPNILIKLFFVFRCCWFGYKSEQGWDNSAGLNSPWCCSGASLRASPAFSHTITSTSCASILPFIQAPSRNFLSQSSTEDWAMVRWSRLDRRFSWWGIQQGRRFSKFPLCWPHSQLISFLWSQGPTQGSFSCCYSPPCR